jgi:hypothetical protein
VDQACSRGHNSRKNRQQIVRQVGNEAYLRPSCMLGPAAACSTPAGQLPPSLGLPAHLQSARPGCACCWRRCRQSARWPWWRRGSGPSRSRHHCHGQRCLHQSVHMYMALSGLGGWCNITPGLLAILLTGDAPHLMHPSLLTHALPPPHPGCPSRCHTLSRLSCRPFACAQRVVHA